MQNRTFFSFDNKTDNNLLNYKNKICFDQNSKKKYEKILSVLDPDNNGLTSSEVQSLWFEIKNSASQTAQNNVLNTNEATQFVKARFKNKQISVSNFIDFIKLVTDTVNKSFNKMNLTKHYNTQFSSELIGKKVAPNKKYTLVNLQRLYPKNKGYEVKSINGEFHVTKNGKDCIIYYIKCDGGASIDDKDNNLYTIENPDGTLNAIYNGDKLIGFDSHFNPSQQLKNKNEYHNGNEFYITKKGNSLGITNRSNFRVTIVDFDKILKSKEFANKQMKINAKEGLVAQDMDTNSPIPLHKLSSGEQNLIILYFYLLFKTTPDMTICLDEPENSLHVAWQETMLTDLRTIADVLKLQIIVATHSVDFVNGNWGDCFDLFEGMKKNVNEL